MDESSAWKYSPQVNQAAGMVSVQAECLVEDAVTLMQDRATVGGVTIEEIAAGVLDRSIRFGD